MSLAYAAQEHVACDIPRLTRATSVEIEAALADAGCAIVESAVDPRELAVIDAELGPWFERAARGEGLFFGRKTKRFSGVFAKAPATAALALHSEILPAIEHILLGPQSAPRGDCVQLSQTQAIEIEPGQNSQLLHRDDNVFPFPKPFELIVNVMWTLDPFTAENGATRLAPGSHLWPREEIEQYEDGVLDATAAPGSAIIWLGSLLHGGGANRSALPRRGLVMSYSLGWLAPAEKLLLSIPPEVARYLPERLQRLIGYQIHRPNLGWVEARDPIEWLRGETHDLAAASDNLTLVQSEMLNAYLQSVGRT
jgi:ectoine hydroxylase-related dioxygenase (phytanoyl-CoA dioxygenase family)